MEQSIEDSKLQKQLGIYKKVRLLGSGSFGKAYLVKQISDDSEWVIKQINLCDMMPKEQEEAEKEVKILEMLEHPNIVRFKEVYRTSKMKLNIVMEYADGGDIADRIKTAKEASSYFEEADILKWLVQICIGVKYIHDRKIIHRDLKAQNIFLTADNQVKIGDFGVAKVMQNTMAKARTVVGSPYYISPQIINNKPYSYKTDIWSLGTLLFEMCSLAPPFTANNIQFLALKIVKGTYSPIPNKYSQELRNLIKTMLHTKEEMRPSMAQILSTKIISETMKKMVQESIQVKHQTKMQKNFIKSLKAPPNLMQLEQIGQNKSEIITKSKCQIEAEEVEVQKKPKTPVIASNKKGSQFFNRPTTSRRSVQQHSQLSDLIQIKPSHLQPHQELRKEFFMAPAPKVPKYNYHRNIQKDPINQQKFGKKEEQEEVSPSAFRKKKSAQLKDVQPIKKQNILQKKQKVHFTIHQINNLQAKDTQAKENPKKKPQIRKKKIIKEKPSQQADNQQMEVCSEQAKKKIIREKSNEKKKKKEAPKKKTLKKEKSSNQQETQKVEEIMEEEKCNSEADINSQADSQSDTDYYYDNEQFQDYFDSSSEGDDVDFSLSDSEESPQKKDISKMIKEMRDINKLVEQGNVTDLPMLGESIPQVINFSSEIREDSDFDSNSNSSSKKQERLQQINIFVDHNELENLRMKLEGIFGEEDIIKAYQAVEAQIEHSGLDFDEEKTIARILMQHPSIKEVDLSKYFRLIVTIISLENQLI